MENNVSPRPSVQLMPMSAPGLLPGSAFLQRGLPGSMPLAPGVGGGSSILGAAPPHGGFPLVSMTPYGSSDGRIGFQAGIPPSTAGSQSFSSSAMQPHASSSGVHPTKVTPLDVPTVVRALTGHGPLDSQRSIRSSRGGPGGAVRAFEDPHLLAVRAVMLRELHVQRLANLCRKFASANDALVGAANLPSQLRQLRRNIEEHKAEIIQLVTTIRESTLDVVETICRWREREAKTRAQGNGLGGGGGSSSRVATAVQGRRAASPINFGMRKGADRQSRLEEGSADGDDIEESSSNSKFTVDVALPEFSWKGRNYLLQVAIDTIQVLSLCKVPLRSWIGIDSRGNPTLSPLYVISPDDAIPQNAMQLLAKQFQMRHPKWSETIEKLDIATALSHATEPPSSTQVSSTVWSANNKPKIGMPPSSARSRSETSGFGKSSRHRSPTPGEPVQESDDLMDYDGIEAHALAAGVDPSTVAIYGHGDSAPSKGSQSSRDISHGSHSSISRGASSHSGDAHQQASRIIISEEDVARLRTAHAVIARSVTDSIRILLEQQEREALRAAALEEEARAKAELDAKREAEEVARQMDEKMREAFVPTIVMRLNRSDPSHIDPRSLKYRLDLYDMYPPELDVPPQTPSFGESNNVIKPVPPPEPQESAEVGASVEERLEELRSALRTPPDGTSRREHMLKLLGVIDDMYAPEEGESATANALHEAFEAKSPDASRRASLAGALSSVLVSVDDAMAEIEKELAYRRRWADMNFCAMKIQAIYRGFHQRIMYAIKIKVENAAARSIQASYRGYMYRKRMGSLLGLRRSSTRIANWWRVIKARRKVADLRRHTLYAKSTAKSAVLMQSAVRGALARRRVTGIRRVANLVQRCVKLAAGIKAENLAGLGDLLVKAYSQASARGREGGVAADGAITYTILVDGLRPLLLIMQSVLCLVAPMAWRLKGVRPNKKMVSDPIGSMAQIIQAQGGFSMTTTEERNAVALPGVDISSHVNPLLGPFMAASQAGAAPSMLPPGVVGPIFSEDRGAWVCFRIQALTNDVMGRTSGLLITPTALAAASACLLDSSVQRLAGNLALISRAQQSGGEEAVRALPPGPARLASVLPPELRPTAMFLLTWTMAACRIAELTPAYLSERVLREILQKSIEASEDILSVSSKKFAPMGDATIPTYRQLGIRPWFLRPRPVVVVLSYDLPSGVSDHIIRGLEIGGGSSFIAVDPESEIVGIGIGNQPSVSNAVNAANRGLIVGASAKEQEDESGPAGPIKNAIPPPPSGLPVPTLNRYRGNAGAYRRRLLHRLHNVLSGGHDAIVKVCIGSSAFSRERFMRDIVQVLGLLQPHSVPLVVLVAGIGVTMNTGRIPSKKKGGASERDGASKAAEEAVLKAAAEASTSATEAAAQMKKAEEMARAAAGGSEAQLAKNLSDPNVDPFTNEPAALAATSFLNPDDAREVDEAGRAIAATMFETLELRYMPAFIRNQIFNTWAAPQRLEALSRPRGSNSNALTGRSSVAQDEAGNATFTSQGVSGSTAKFITAGPINLHDLHMNARVGQLEDCISCGSLQRANSISAAFSMTTFQEKSRLELMLLSLPADKAAAVQSSIEPDKAIHPSMDPYSGAPVNPFDGALRVATGITLHQATEEKYSSSSTASYRYSLSQDLQRWSLAPELLAVPKEVRDVAGMFVCLLSLSAKLQPNDPLGEEDFEGDLKLDDEEQGVQGTETKEHVTAGHRIGEMRGAGKLVGGGKTKKKVGSTQKPSEYAAEDYGKVKNYYKQDHGVIKGKGKFEGGASVSGYVSKEKVWACACKLFKLPPNALAARMAKAPANLTQMGQEAIRKYTLWFEQLSVTWPRAAVGNSPLTSAVTLPYAAGAPLDVPSYLISGSPGFTVLAHWCTMLMSHLACVNSKEGPARPLTGPQEILELDAELKWVPKPVPGLIFSSIVHVGAQVTHDSYTAYFAAADREVQEHPSKYPAAANAAERRNGAPSPGPESHLRPVSSFGSSSSSSSVVAPRGSLSPTPANLIPAPRESASTPMPLSGGPPPIRGSSSGVAAASWNIEGRDGIDLLIDEDDSILTIPFRSFAAAPQKRKTKTDEESISRVASPNSFFLNAALPAAGGADDVSLSSSQLTARSGRTKSVVSFCRGATDAYSLVMVSHLRDLRVHTQRADVPVDFVSRLLLRQVAASAAANSASASTTVPATASRMSRGSVLGSPSSRPMTRAPSPLDGVIPPSRGDGRISRLGQGLDADHSIIMNTISNAGTPGGPLAGGNSEVVGFSAGIGGRSNQSYVSSPVQRLGTFERAGSPFTEGGQPSPIRITDQSVLQTSSSSAAASFSILQTPGLAQGSHFPAGALHGFQPNDSHFVDAAIVHMGDSLIRDAQISVYRDGGRIVFVVYAPSTGHIRWSAMPDDPFLLMDLINAGSFVLTAGLDEQEKKRIMAERRRGDRAIHSWIGLIAVVRILVPTVLAPPPYALAIRPFLESSARIVVRPTILPLFNARRAIPCAYGSASEGSMVLASITAFSEAGVGICSGTFRCSQIIFRAHIVAGATHGSTTLILRVTADDVSDFLGLLPPTSTEYALLTSPAATPLDFALCMLDRLGLFDDPDAPLTILDDATNSQPRSRTNSSMISSILPRSRSGSEAPSVVSQTKPKAVVESHLLLTPSKGVLPIQPKSAIFNPSAAGASNSFMRPSTVLVPNISFAAFLDRGFKKNDGSNDEIEGAGPGSGPGTFGSTQIAFDTDKKTSIANQESSYLPLAAAGRALARESVGLTSSMAICTELASHVPQHVSIKDMKENSPIIGRPISIVSPLGPSTAIARGVLSSEIFEEWEQSHIALRKMNAISSKKEARSPKLALKVSAGGMGGQLLGTAVINVAVPAAKIAAAEAALAAREKTSTMTSSSSSPNKAAGATSQIANTMAALLGEHHVSKRVRISVFQPTWFPDAISNRDMLASAPATGVSAVGVVEDHPDDVLHEADHGVDEVEKSSSWAAVTSRLKAKVIEDTIPSRLLVVVDDLHEEDNGLVVADDVFDEAPIGLKAQLLREKMMKEKGFNKNVERDEAIAIFAEAHQVLVADAVIFEVSPLERVALLGGYRSVLPRLLPGSPKIRADDQLISYGEARHHLVTAVAARTLAADITPSLVAERSVRNSPMLLRSLLSPRATHAAEISFDRAILRQTFKPSLARTLQADIRLPENPDTFFKQFPEEIPDAMTAFAMSDAGIPMTGAGAKRRMKAIPLDGLHIFVREGGTAFGTISVPGAELKGILQRAKAEAERRAGRNAKNNRPPSSLSISGPTERSSTPKSALGRSAVATPSFAPSGLTGTISAAIGTVTSVITQATSSDEMVALSTKWPRTPEELFTETALEAKALEDSDLALMQSGEGLSHARLAAKAALTQSVARGAPPLPYSLILQAKALMARVPEIVAQRVV
jgi:hypothetical protein